MALKYLSLFFLIISIQLQAQTPAAVSQNLKKASANSIQLEMAVKHFKKAGNPMKLQALYYLIEHMDDQISANYFWTNKLGKKIPFNELAYKDEAAAQTALDKLKKSNPDMRAVSYVSSDLETMKASELIDNIDKAFEAWQRSPYKAISFEDFCAHILPYRVSVEPFQPWRSFYQQKYKWVADTLKSRGLLSTLLILKADQRSIFESTWGKERRMDPLPRLGAMQLLFRKKGMCEDGVAFSMLSLRSQGIPCAQNIVPYWATSTGGHFFTTVYDTKTKPITYDQFNDRTPLKGQLVREPGKVLRLTFASQGGTLASLEKKDAIPDGVLRMKNYVDVTSEFWPVADISGKVYSRDSDARIVYSSVFNGMNWRPIWWSKVVNGAYKFTKMAKGAVYLPSIYEKGRMRGAGPPVAMGYNNTKQLVANKSKMISIIMAEQEGYLRFKPGMYYTLYYWDQQWIPADKQAVKPMAKQMQFNSVPSDALYIMIPDRPIGKERPFIITPKGERIWF